MEYINDLPIRRVNPKRTSHLTACIEVKEDVPIPNWDIVAKQVVQSAPPFSAPPDSNVQVYARMQDDGRYAIVKLMSFDIRQSVQVIGEYCDGMLHSLHDNSRKGSSLATTRCSLYRLSTRWTLCGECGLGVAFQEDKGRKLPS